MSKSDSEFEGLSNVFCRVLSWVIRSRACFNWSVAGRGVATILVLGCFVAEMSVIWASSISISWIYSFLDPFCCLSPSPANVQKHEKIAGFFENTTERKYA